MSSGEKSSDKPPVKPQSEDEPKNVYVVVLGVVVPVLVCLVACLVYICFRRSLSKQQNMTPSSADTDAYPNNNQSLEGVRRARPWVFKRKRKIAMYEVKHDDGGLENNNVVENCYEEIQEQKL